MCYDAGWTRNPGWRSRSGGRTVREVVSCELVDELAPREYITMRPSHDISHPDTYCTGNDGS